MILDSTLRVLVFDEEPAIVTLLVTFLTREGYVVQTAADYADVVKKAAGDGFSLILLATSRMMGRERVTIQALRAAGVDLPVILLAAGPSGLPDENVHLLRKPFKLEELKSAIARALQRD